MSPTHTLRYSARPLRAKADVWRPAGPGPFPSALLVHGGGFITGHRRMRAARFLAERLCAAGIAVVAPDWRLFWHGARLDEALDDVRAAARWWAANADAWQADPTPVAIGLSAGAALVTLAARDLPLRGLVGVYGAYDFTNLPGRSRGTALLLRTRDRAAWATRSPVACYDADIPTLLAHGTADRLVPIAHTEALAAARRARGLPVDVRTYDGARHGFLRHPDLPASDRCAADVVGFVQAVRQSRTAEV